MTQQTNVVAYPQKIIVSPSTQHIQVVGNGPGDVSKEDLSEGLNSKVNKEGGTMTGPLILPGTPDATLAQSGPLLIGDEEGANLTVDSNEIQARVNGAATTLYLNEHGGAVEASALVLPASPDVSLEQSGPLLIGPEDWSNLTMDANEIQSRNNGAASLLHINLEGGDVHMNGVNTTTPAFFESNTISPGAITGDTLMTGWSAYTNRGGWTIGGPSNSEIAFPERGIYSITFLAWGGTAYNSNISGVASVLTAGGFYIGQWGKFPLGTGLGVTATIITAIPAGSAINFTHRSGGANITRTYRVLIAKVAPHP